MSNIPRLLRLPLSDCQTGWLGLGACSDKVLSVGHFFIAFVDCKSTIPDLLQCKCEKGAWFNDRLASNFVRWGIKATSVFLDEMRSASSQLSHIFIELQQCKFFWTSAYKFMSREEAYEFKRRCAPPHLRRHSKCICALFPTSSFCRCQNAHMASLIHPM